MDVTDRVAIVTGGAMGIGRGIAVALAKHGADVVIADLKKADQVVAEVEKLGRRSLALVADVCDQASMDRMVLEVIEGFDRVDILVNNAGLIVPPADEQDWDLMYAVNVKAVARMTDAVSPHMKAQRYGKIINVSSYSGRQGDPANNAYAASKAASISLTQAAAQELAPFDINVNAICPGNVWTPMWETEATRWCNSPENTEGLSPRDMFARVVKETSLFDREQTAEDMGNLAVFLASEYARNITGQSINLDGGAVMS